mgnify:CR=1 FL=1
MVGYLSELQWLLSEDALKHVTLPPYTAGCGAVAEKVACDYPPCALKQIARVAFMESGSPAATVIKNFTGTNADQNSVAKSLAVDKLTDDAAAKIWVDAHPDQVAAWIKG